ncbi:MAG: hypothetical protein U1E29_18245 [Coriobacteriia bacterium]|nr:hypothetical protein [Coriobacteriia bacterium]
MANAFAAAVAYITQKLDEGYKLDSLSGDLNIAPAWIKEGAAAGEFKLPKITLVGLGTVTGGIMPVGDVTQEWVTYSYAYKRGRTLQATVTDIMEAARIAQMAMLSKMYMRSHVIPEVDAIRFSRFYAGTNAAHKASTAITNSAEAIAATNAGLVAIAEAEAIVGRCIGYATPEILDLLDSAAVTEKKARFLTRLAKVVEVPSGRWSTAVSLDAGASSAAGGFTMTGDDIQFAVIDPEAVFCDTKHSVDRFFPAEVNQMGDLDRWDYYAYHDAWVLSEKDKGLYFHTEAAVS